ncbi:hypothetical protein [Aureicoccus marinus]|uniref:Uncharacterized protein n=1 Tax=Aureicoccus marinus TaxID=754435 RepID=A0A2S7T4Q9_9FLAO|nr:hypothetical protein [Aureicoccus marinus]PQJ14561.1 hypothetical protein BST99_01285 [Aureicoccus marinus]
MKNENIPSELFDLIADKSFEELTSKERPMVEEWLTAEEYSDYRSFVTTIRQTDSERDYQLSERSWTQQSALNLNRLANRPIPAYQVAALVLLVFGLSFLLPTSSSPEKKEPVLVENTEGTPISQDSYPEDLVFNP